MPIGTGTAMVISSVLTAAMTAYGIYKQETLEEEQVGRAERYRYEDIARQEAQRRQERMERERERRREWRWREEDRTYNRAQDFANRMTALLSTQPAFANQLTKIWE